MDTGNTAWVLAATALVLFMTPGLALFYGGMVRSKNVLGMLMQNFFAMGILAVLWVGDRVQPRVRRRGQRRVHRQLRLRVPEGRRARRCSERAGQLLRLPDHPVRAVLRVPDDVRDHHARADHRGDGRPPEVLRVRGLHRRCGWSSCTRRSRTGCSPAAGSPSMGALDFAGGAVVHINAGAAALALVLLLGVRKGYPEHADAAAQPADDDDRHRHPVVRLGRVQRRLGARRQRRRRRRRS